MKWTYAEPTYGDMIRVAVGSIYHFGIYVSDDEVIQFGLPPSRRGNQPDSEVEVLVSDIDGFLAGGFLEVSVFDKKEKHLSLRAFTPSMKRSAYERQKGICPHCARESREKIRYDITEMEADHITPWCEGGKTELGNCQMLCIEHNRLKSNK